VIVCIEGVDACGKSTQAETLAKRMGCELVAFPNYTSPTGHLIEGHLKRYWGALPHTGSQATYPEVSDVDALNAFVFQALQLTNRMELAVQIAKARKTDADLVLARYWPSGWVYGLADGLPEDWLYRIHEYLPQPDLFVLLDVDAEQSVGRRPQRRDRYEENEDLMARCAQLYRRLWREQAQERGKLWWRVVDGREGEEHVADAVWDAVSWLR
jgi:thymidylate kinase